MRINRISDSAHKREFEIETGEKTYIFPYAKLRLVPSASDPVVEVFVDPELGDEAFTYRLKSGKEDTIHVDAVLEINKDPDYLQELLLHRLTVEVLDGLKEAKLGVRQLARQLDTSPSQMYRLLDPDNTSKSVGQMLALLELANRRMEILISSISEEWPDSAGVFQVYRDKRGDYRFRLKDADGGVVLSSDAYRSKESCLRTIRKVRNYAMHDAHFERKMTSGGRFQFRLKAKDHDVIAWSPSFKSASRRDAALATVRRKASELKVEEASV